MSRTWLCCSFCFLASIGSVWQLSAPTVGAQESKPEAKPEAPADPKPAEGKPAEAKPADAKPADAKPEAKPADSKPEAPADAKPSPEAEAATKAFEAKMADWKTLLKDLRALKIKFQTAKPDETDEIRKQFDALLVKGEQMLPELRTAAKAAYLAAPNVDLQLARFLAKMLADDIERDDFEAADELARALVENNCEILEVYDAAGVAAFVKNDYDAAEKYFQIASDAGVLKSKLGVEFKGLVKSYREIWAAEQKLREAEAAKDDLPRVKISTTKGDIVVELFENEAPETVGNFVSLVENKFYDGLSFHRVLPGFMAQGGCPIGDGTGDPGYKIYCECYKDDHRKHFRGSLSMAKGASKDSGGSQFFLTFIPTVHLNGKHTVFGRVVEGLDVLAKIQRIDPQGPRKSADVDKIVKAEVLRKRDHKYEPNKVK